MTNNTSIKSRLEVLEDWMQSSGQAIFDIEMQLFHEQLRTFEPVHYIQLGGPTLMKGFGVQGHYFHVDLRDDFFSPGLSVCADFECLPFADGSMDLVLCPHVHELYDNQGSLFQEINRVLSVSGRLLIFGINMNSLWSIQRVFGEHVAAWCDCIVPVGNVIQVMHEFDFRLMRHGSFGKIPFGRSHWLKSLPALGRVSYSSPHIGAIYVLLFERDMLCLDGDVAGGDAIG